MIASLLTDYRLTDLCPPMQIRNSFKLLLQKPIVKTRTYGNRWFTRVAADFSNTLPEKLQEEESLGGFKKMLKTHLFKLEFTVKSAMSLFLKGKQRYISIHLLFIIVNMSSNFNQLVKLKRLLFLYNRITSNRVRSLWDPTPCHVTLSTQLLSKKCLSDSEPLAIH